MSLPLTHAGGSVDGISAALDLRFASSLSLTSTSGLTPSFSRASGGTFTGSNGLLKYTPLNLVTYSEDFTNAVWSKTRTSVSANVANAPDGKNTADKLIETAVSNTHAVSYATTTGGNFSVFAKAAERSWVALQKSSTGNFCYFNLSNGTVGSASGATGSIDSVGNGWYRCSISVPVASSAWDIFIATGDNGASYTGDGTSGVFIWGAQLVSETTLGAYAQTTTTANSAPRFNHVYNGSSWVSKGLLIEEQRVNYVKYANDLSTNWTNEVGATREYNSIASPDGSTNATKVNVAVSGLSGIYQHSLLNGGSGTYTYSIFAKKGTKDWLIILNAAGSGSSSTFFNISNGTIGTVFSGYSATIVNVGNGWYRCILTTASSTTPSFFQIALSDANNTITPASTGYSYVYGAQVELGAFPTSFIPNNTASSVTRSADVCQITGGDFTSFWNASEGSFVTEADSIGFASTGLDRYITTFNSGGTANIAHAIFLPTTGLSFDVYNSTLQARVSYTQPNAGDLFKLASCYKANDFAATLNGSAVQTDTSGTVPTINNVGIGHYPSFNQYANCHISRLRYYNKRLTNKQLEDLCKPEEQLKLDLNFNSSLSLTPTVGPTPSYSRASTGTYFNASGVLTSAAINAPRFDHTYNGTSWVSRGLLVEEQRTNLLQYSEQFNTSPWATLNASISANAIPSPDGNTTADKLVESATGPHGHEVYYLFTASSATYTTSVFAKAGERSSLYISLGSTINNGVYFNLSSGTVGTATGGLTGQIQNVGNGWYRCSVTGALSAGSNYIQIALSNGTTYDYTGNGTSGLYLFGAQLEVGSFPTSYIPTTTAAVTRSADVCQITGGDFSGFWNASEGTISLEQDLLSYSDPAADQRYFSIAGSSNSPAFILNYDNGTNFFWYRNFSGLDQLVLPDVNSAFKVALAFRTNDYATVLNGGTPVTSSTKTLPTTFTKMDIGYQVGSTARSSWIQRLRYYAIRLPNRLLIAKSQ